MVAGYYSVETQCPRFVNQEVMRLHICQQRKVYDLPIRSTERLLLGTSINYKHSTLRLMYPEKLIVRPTADEISLRGFGPELLIWLSPRRSRHSCMLALSVSRLVSEQYRGQALEWSQNEGMQTSMSSPVLFADFFELDVGMVKRNWLHNAISVNELYKTLRDEMWWSSVVDTPDPSLVDVQVSGDTANWRDQ